MKGSFIKLLNKTEKGLVGADLVLASTHRCVVGAGGRLFEFHC